MFYKIFVFMLLVGMSCVGASQKHAPGDHGGTGQTKMSDEDLRKKYDEVSGEIAALTMNNLIIIHKGNTQTIPKITELVNKIKGLDTHSSYVREFKAWQSNRSYIWSIYLIEALLEKVKNLNPKNEYSIYFEVARQCWDAVNAIIPYSDDTKSARKSFVDYFNQDLQFKYNKSQIGDPNKYQIKLQLVNQQYQILAVQLKKPSRETQALRNGLGADREKKLVRVGNG